MPPLVGTGGHDVYVAVKKQRWRKLTASETSHEIRVFWVTRQQLGVDRALLKDSPDELETCALIARWIRRVELNQLSQELYGIPSHEAAVVEVASLPHSHRHDDRGWQ
jgi:hypothetical protein